MGCNLAHSEAADRLDQRQRAERHPNPRTIETHGPDGLPDITRQRVSKHPAAVLYGLRQPLPDVWKVRSRLPANLNRDLIKRSRSLLYLEVPRIKSHVVFDLIRLYVPLRHRCTSVRQFSREFNIPVCRKG